MTKLNIVIHSKSVGIQLFDKFYAYRQFLDKLYQSDINICFSDQPTHNSINILFSYMPSDDLTDIIKDYDLVILDNGEEPLSLANTKQMLDLIEKYKHVYVQANSVYFADNSPTKNLIYYCGDLEKIRDYYNRSFYPQYYYTYTNGNKNGMVYINGQNRAHRWHFVNLLNQHNHNITILNNLTAQDQVQKTYDCAFESTYDCKFRDFVNKMYNTMEQTNYCYYDNSVTVGINGEFGTVPPGYFMMEEYNNSHCVVFPETNWVNNELCITEKSIKCFIAKTFAMPVAGANVNKLYNSIGFKTAWNLLPKELQEFDNELDHDKRYKMLANAVTWLDHNQHVFKSDLSKSFLHENYLLFLENKHSIIGVEQFNKIIESLL